MVAMPFAFRRHIASLGADPARRPYSAAEVAEICGVTVDHFRKVRPRLHAQDRLPMPYKESGKLAFDRARIDAWRQGRNLPLAANDAAPVVPASDAEHRAYLHAHYARAR